MYILHSLIKYMLHPNAKDLTGTVIGRLKIIRQSGISSDKHLAWDCLCECGKTKRISSNSLMRKNPVQSCGCMNKTAAQRKKRIDGAWNEGKSYAIEGGLHCYKTRHGWAKALIRMHGNKCQKCGWDKARCDAHHKDLKSTGGLHTLENGIVLCPNCHRIEHENGIVD